MQFYCQQKEILLGLKNKKTEFITFTMNKFPKVSIIILNWNGWRDTLSCIDSLAKIKYPNYEALIVDNGSDDESIEKLEVESGRWEVEGINFKLIENKENLGFAGGNNRGIEEAIKNGADYVLLLNNDTIVDPIFLDKLIEAGESDKNIGIIGSKIYFYSDPNRIWFAGGKINWLKTKGYHLKLNEKEPDRQGSDGIEKILPADYITGCAILIKREVIEKIGYLGEDYFLYYEDTDYCLRARKSGWQCVLAPKSHIWHKISQSTKELSPSYIYYHTRNGLLMAKRMNSVAKIILVYIFSIFLAVKQIIKYIFFPSKREWARMVLLGIEDFWRGKMGRF